MNVNDPRLVARKPRTRGLRFWGLAGLVLLAVIVIWGIALRIEASFRLREQTDQQAIPTVEVTRPVLGPAEQELVQPGTVQALYEAQIYARVSGYLKRWTTDIGTKVKKGQLLAEIDTPELDAELRQAEADLVTAQANDRFARSTAERWVALSRTNSVSRQDTEQKVADAAARDAEVKSMQARVARLREMEGFKRVTAPFDGVVTERRTDLGALIAAGSGSGPELFRVAQTDRLRIYVQVPQTYAAEMKPGLAATLHFAEYPGRAFPAKVVRTADALDPASRTLLVELQVANDRNELLPGGYTEVHLKLAGAPRALRIPVNTLLFRAEGLKVATLDGNDHVQLKPVTLGRDFGVELEVATGLSAEDTLVVNPPDALTTGDLVRIAAKPAKK